MPLILGGSAVVAAAGATGGCQFNASTAYIERGSVTPTSEQIFSFSAWVKLSGISGAANQMVFNQARNGVATDSMNFYINTSSQLCLWVEVGNSVSIDLVTSRKFKDCGAWYNLAFNISMADGTTGDRAQIFVNGVRETAFATATYPTTQNINCMDDNASNRTRIGGGAMDSSTVNNYFDGDLSHVHFVDGVAYAGSNWGETDSDSGIWQINLDPTVSSYGNRGFNLKMEDSSDLDLDSSPNATTMTTSGTLTATKDNPSNNFCTFNPLDNFWAAATFTNGNDTVATVGGNYSPLSTTYGLTKGLWYWELKQTSHSAVNQQTLAGISGNAWTSAASISATTQLGKHTQQYAFYAESGKIVTDDVAENYGTTQAEVDDIIQCYIDLDANKIYFAVNDTLGSSTGFDITATASTLNQYYNPAVSYWSGTSGVLPHNFGNGYFATTAVTSAVADAGGEGAFEYDPSRGGASDFDGSAKNFRAICSNNLATYG